jgi:hypothetical protein
MGPIHLPGRGGVAGELSAGLVLVLFLALPSQAQGPDLGSLGLAPGALWAIRDHGFVVVPGTAPDIGRAYAELSREGIPPLITVDSALSSTDALIDATILSLESGDLYDRLAELSRELVRLSEQQYILASDSMVREAARRNLAFFAVGLSLLDPDYFPPEFVLALVERELGLIEDGRAVAISPIMGPTPLDGVLGPGEDYSQYVPRGPYALNDRLARFHRAATWYGRMAFALPEGRAADYGLTRQALLVVLALRSEAGEHFDLWERIYDPTVFYLGTSGDPTVREYTEIAQDVFGEEFDVEDIASADLLAEFVGRVAEVAPAHFETHELRGMRLLGRPYLPDTPIFAKLGISGDRTPATTVDLMALLGSSVARELLDENDAFASDVYRRGFRDVELEFAAMTYGDWTRDLAMSWLYALSAFVRRPPAGAPAFATSPAWDARALSTGVAAWAVLSERALPPRVGSVPSEPAGEVSPLVEPYPEVYARLRELLEHLRDRLWQHYLLTEEVDEAIAGQNAFLTSLEQASRSVRDGGTSGEAERGLGNHPATLARLSEQVLDVLSAGGGEQGWADAGSVGFPGEPSRGREPGSPLGLPDVIYAVVGTGDAALVHAGAIYSLLETKGEGAPGGATEPTSQAGAAARPPWVTRFLSP